MIPTNNIKSSILKICGKKISLCAKIQGMMLFYLIEFSLPSTWSDYSVLLLQIGKNGRPAVVQGCTWEWSMEAYRLYLVACRCHTCACKHAELGLYWHPSGTAIRLWYAFFLPVFWFKVLCSSSKLENIKLDGSLIFSILLKAKAWKHSYIVI